MSFLFNPDSPLINKINKAVDIILLGFLFAISSVPIFTLGGALTALYSITLNMAEDNEGAIFKTYFSEFRKHFIKSTQIFLIMLLLAIFFILDLVLIYEISGLYVQILSILLLMFAIIYAIVFSYIFPLTAKHDWNIRTLFNRSIHLAVSNFFPTTLIITPLTFLPISLPLMNPELYIEWFPLFIFLLPGTITYVNSKFLVSIINSKT